ncbi:MAG: hypothetical protein V7721_06560, partial [Porticoccaceae bacterium]
LDTSFVRCWCPLKRVKIRVATAILLFTKVYGKEDKVDVPATQSTFFFDMYSDGYTRDDKRQKEEGYGDLQNIINKYNARNLETDTDRKLRWFMVPYSDIKNEKYDLSFSRYKEDVFEEIEYEKPKVILQNLIDSEVGENIDEAILTKIEGGIVKELLALRDIVE